jgi:hypothetical protein
MKEREMTTLVRSIAFAGGILLVGAIQDASAQIDYPVEFTTTFPFTVGQATVPAGTYTIKAVDDDPALLELSGQRVGLFFQASSATASGKASRTEVVFKRYGKAYVLKDVWLEGADTGIESVAAEGERRVDKSQGPEAEERVVARKK